jgi:hypothetical protein
MVRYLKRNDLVRIRAGHRVYADVPKHFVYENRYGDFSLAHTDVTVGEHKSEGCPEFNTNHLLGHYRVVARAKDGHHVFCERVISDEYETIPRYLLIDFYQSGSFTAVIKPEEIEVVNLSD